MDMIEEVLPPCLWTAPIYNEPDDEEVDEDHFEEPWIVVSHTNITMCGSLNF
jgi:hypothetical protein